MNVNEEKKKNDLDQAIYLNADNIAMFHLFRKDNNEKEEHILVCNTHLVFPPNQSDKKLSQIIIILKAIETIMDYFRLLFIFHINMIIFYYYNYFQNFKKSSKYPCFCVGIST